MGVAGLEERLSRMDEDWQAAKVVEPGELPPDGDYQAIVDRFDFFESKKHQVFLKTELRITAGDYEGTPVEVIHNLEDPERISWAKQHLQRLGLQLDSLAGLKDALKDALDVPVEIAIKTSDRTDAEGNPYRNVYVNKRLGPPVERERSDIPADPPDPPPSDNSDDDIPF